MFDEILSFIRSVQHQPEGFIALHEPRFGGNEKLYLEECIDSTYVSSVGKFVGQFEDMMKQLTGAKVCVATANGSLALHMALKLAGVKPGDLVITQPLTFVATCNAIAYTGAEPVFVDVDPGTLGLSAGALEDFLKDKTTQGVDKQRFYKDSGRRISACLPMHTFGHPCQIDRIAEICKRYNIPLVEDAAESVGSLYRGKHTGTFGMFGTFSFNGNKTVTCGGGGAIVTDDEHAGRMAKHLTTQAKVPHPWEFVHDEVGYNYRLPNLNAALACAQLEQLEDFVNDKRALASEYKTFFESKGLDFVSEPEGARSNYWLNAILLPDRSTRNAFLEYSNARQIMTRPAWTLMTDLPMFKHCIAANIDQARNIESRLVNIPSSVRKKV